MTARQHRRGILTTAIILTALARSAYGDPPTHLQSPSAVHTDGGTDLRLPPGYFLDEPSFSKLDVEMRRLQDQETRLTAENKSLRLSLEKWQPGWVTLGTAIALGMATGYYASRHL